MSKRINTYPELLRFLWAHRASVIRVAVYFPPNDLTATSNRLFWMTKENN